MELRNITFDGHKFYQMEDMIVGHWIDVDNTYLLNDEWEIFAITHLINNIKFDWNCADIGANWGAYSCIMSHRTLGMVHSFEPHPDNFNLLSKNTDHCRNVKKYNFALGLKKESLNLMLSKGSGGHSLKIKRSDNSILVNVLSLDSLNLALDCIKLDVEGAGYDILLGAQETLKKVKYISMEVHAGTDEKKAYQFLQDLGFTIQSYNKYNFIATRF